MTKINAPAFLPADTSLDQLEKRVNTLIRSYMVLTETCGGDTTQLFGVFRKTNGQIIVGQQTAASDSCLAQVDNKEIFVSEEVFGVRTAKTNIFGHRSTSCK